MGRVPSSQPPNLHTIHKEILRRKKVKVKSSQRKTNYRRKSLNERKNLRRSQSQLKARQRIQGHKNNYISWKNLETMEPGLRLQIEKLETKLRRYGRDNEYLRNMNTKSEVMIKLHKIQEMFNEQKISDHENHIEKLSAKFEELKNKSNFNQRLKNQDIKKEINDYEAEIIRLNKIINDKDEELMHIR